MMLTIEQIEQYYTHVLKAEYDFTGFTRLTLSEFFAIHMTVYKGLISFTYDELEELLNYHKFTYIVSRKEIERYYKIKEILE